LIVGYKFILKSSLKRLRVSTYFGLKRAMVRFKSFDTFTSHSFLVSPRRYYEVAYSLETEEGEIVPRIDKQIQVTAAADVRKEGKEIIKFSRYKPIVGFEGYGAKQGKVSVKVRKVRE